MKNLHEIEQKFGSITRGDDVATLVDTLTSIGILHDILRGHKLTKIERGAVEVTTRYLINIAFNIAAGEELSLPDDSGSF